MGKRETIRNLFLRNKELKLVSLLLATISWYAIRRAISFEAVLRDVPLRMEVDEGWAVLESSAQSVDVVFVGSQDSLRNLDPEKTAVRVDLKGKTAEGSIDVTLRPRDVKALGSARAVGINPSVVELSLDREGEVKVPVKAELAGELPVGFEIEKSVCTPATVLVFGPSSKIKEVQSVISAPIDLGGRTRSFQTRVPLRLPSDRVIGRIEPDSAVVDVTLVERSATRDLQDVRVNALISPDLGPAVRIWPNKVNLVLSGRSDLINSVQRSDIHAYIDCSDLEPAASYDLPVRVYAPAGIKVISVAPDTAEVEVGKL